MSRLITAVSAALLFATPAWAELSPEEVGKIQADQKAAVDKVRAENGNKSEKDMTPEERRQESEAENQASLGVLQKHGVSDKEFTRYSNRMDRSEQAEAKQAEEAAEKAKKAPAAEAKSDKPADVVEVQRGVDNAHPMEIEVQNKENGVVVDRGTPVSELENGKAPAAKSAPARSSHGSSHHRSHHSKSRHHRGR